MFCLFVFFWLFFGPPVGNSACFVQARPFKTVKSLVVTTAGALFGSSSAPPGASVAVTVTQAKEGAGDMGVGVGVRRAGAFDMQLVTVETIRTRSPPPSTPHLPLFSPSPTFPHRPSLSPGGEGVGWGWGRERQGFHACRYVPRCCFLVNGCAASPPGAV